VGWAGRRDLIEVSEIAGKTKTTGTHLIHRSALVGSQLFLRAHKYLYYIEEP